MAKVTFLVLFIVLLHGCDPFGLQGTGVIKTEDVDDKQLSDVDSVTANKDIVIVQPEPPKPTLADIYRSQEGLTELTGHNDGAHIAAYHRAAGLNCPVGCAYCSSGVKWTFDQVGIRTTINSWSPTAHNAKNVVYENSHLLKEPRRGDVITLYYKNLGRIGHTGFFDLRVNGDVVKTFEYNTGSTSSSRDGEGNFFKFRPLKTLNSITRWTEN